MSDIVKNNYFVVTCWKAGRLVSETKFDDDNQSKQFFQSAIDSSLYSRVDRCYVELEHWEA